MSGAGLITLLSDFGYDDIYVGVMKGAIAQVNPALVVVDLTHAIPPQAILPARFALQSAFPYFPAGSVHVAVVDPGVGSDRRGIAVAVGQHPTQPQGYLVGPDNGLFSGIWETWPILACVELNQPQYWRSPHPSQTFHGRDIFAPVGAHLASGVPLTQVGTPIPVSALVQNRLPPLIPTPTGLHGCIQAIDHFGNLVTTIPQTAVIGKSWAVQLGTEVVPGQATYSDRPVGSVVALIGSHGWVELGINQGNAAHTLHLQIGDPVTLIWQP